jgi:hypothetical protein
MPASSKTSGASASASGRSHEALIRPFFAAYARRMNDALADPSRIDIKGTREAFARYFVGADPNGVAGGRNGLLFRLMIPRGIKCYRKIGTLAMDVADLRMTDLDDRHVMVHVDWVARYKGGKEIPFTNIYLLQIRDGVPRVFAWITGDEHQVLRDNGLID